MRAPSSPPSFYCWWGFQWRAPCSWSSAFDGAVLAGCWGLLELESHEEPAPPPTPLPGR